MLSYFNYFINHALIDKVVILVNYLLNQFAQFLVIAKFHNFSLYNELPMLMSSGLL